MLCGTGEEFSPRILLKDSKKQDKYAGLLFCSCLVDKWIRKNFKKKMGLLSKIFGDTKKLMTAKNKEKDKISLETLNILSAAGSQPERAETR